MSWLDTFFTAGVKGIQDTGITLPRRSQLDFIGFTVEDDPAFDRTKVTSTAAGITDVTGTAPITVTGTTTKNVALDDDGVTNAKLADMVQATVKGRAAAAGTGNPTDLTQAQLTSLIQVDGSTLEIASSTIREKDGGTTNAKLADMTAGTIKGRASTTGAPQDLSASQVRTILSINAGIVYDTFANRPAANTVPAGTIFSPSDGVIDSQSDGSIWHPRLDQPGPLGVSEPPVLSNWSQIGSDASMSDSYGTLLVSSVGAANDAWQYNTALASDYTVEMSWSTLWVYGGGGNEGLFGIALFESAAPTNGKFIRFSMYMGAQGGDFNVQVQYFNNLTGPSTVKSTVGNTGILRTASAVTLRAVRSGSTYYFYTSQDRKTFSLQTSFATSDPGFTPTRAGFFNGKTASIPMTSRIYSFLLT